MSRVIYNKFGGRGDPRIELFDDGTLRVDGKPADLYSAQRRKRIFVGTFPHPPPGNSPQVLRDKLRLGPFRVGPRLFGRTPQVSRRFDRQSTHAAYPERKAPTVLSNTSRHDAELAVVDPRLPGGLRQMEWQEMAALQGFPEDYLFYGSPTDVAKMVGRAIQIDTGRAILEGIVNQARKEGVLSLEQQHLPPHLWGVPVTFPDPGAEKVAAKRHKPNAHGPF